MTKRLLDISGVSRHFGGVRALNDLELSVDEGEIVGLIGPNGAGKSTLFNVITGVHRANSGSIKFEGADITSRPPHAIARMGLVRSFQANVLFGDQSVLWNVLVGCHIPSKITLLGSVFDVRTTLKSERLAMQQAHRILSFLGLEAHKDYAAKTLSYGQQRILGLAIALATNPKLLLLDEPASGMDADQLKTMLGLIKKTRDLGVTIVLIEHNMRAIFSLCDRIAVLSAGTKLADGTPDEIRKHEGVIAAYLGGGAVVA